MQMLGWLAIGFMLGVAVTVIFGKRIAAAAVADTKAVAYDSARMVNDATARSRAVLVGVETRLHARIDALKTAAAQGIEKL